MKLESTLMLAVFTGLIPGAAWAQEPAKCNVPAGVQVARNMNELPVGLRRDLKVRFHDPSPPGGPFDATDVIVNSPPHFNRIMFVWSRAGRWLVATQHGGIAYGEALTSYTVNDRNESASLLEQIGTKAGTLCARAAQMIETAP